MNEQALLALAAHFTGPDVAIHSIGLQVGGKMKAQAERFFEVRDFLGIRGYPDIAEAKETIIRTLTRED